MVIDPQSTGLLFRRVANRIGRPFGINPFPRAFENPLSEGSKPAEEVFDEIFTKNYWGSPESRSGLGSEVAFATRYGKRLRATLLDRGLLRLFDAPCGDLNWIIDAIKSTDIIYRGGDISEHVVAKAKSGNPDIELSVFDITRDPFPDADVWHCRDCLFHLPSTHIFNALRNFSESSIQYALITNHNSMLLHQNLDVGFGGFRFIDLRCAPYFLPPPIFMIPDYVVGKDFPRYVCLWSRQQIAEALSGAASPGPSEARHG